MNAIAKLIEVFSSAYIAYGMHFRFLSVCFETSKKLIKAKKKTSLRDMLRYDKKMSSKAGFDSQLIL